MLCPHPCRFERVAENTKIVDALEDFCSAIVSKFHVGHPWQRAAFWWSCFTAYVNPSPDDLDQLIADWMTPVIESLNTMFADEDNPAPPDDILLAAGFGDVVVGEDWDKPVVAPVVGYVLNRDSAGAEWTWKHDPTPEGEPPAVPVSVYVGRGTSAGDAASHLRDLADKLASGDVPTPPAAETEDEEEAASA